MNKNYNNGRAKEYRLINKLKKDGYDITFRSAGSHSPIDVIGINKNKSIIFIQSKPRKFSKRQKKIIEDRLDWLNNKFEGKFEIK